MGLDQYMYVLGNRVTEDNKVCTPRNIGYRRKHPNLHGWMERKWLDKNPKNHAGVFNGEELELTWDDLNELERAVTHKQLPGTEGFFFGGNSDERYYADDLQFVRDAKAEIFFGLKVFYNSSW